MTEIDAGDPRVDPPPSRRRRDADFVDFARAAQAGLLHTAWLLTGDRHAAEDAVQEALTRTYVAWRRVRRDSAVAYARKVIVNVVIDGHRRRGRGHATPIEDADGRAEGVHLAAARPQGVVDDRDTAVRALALLTPRERAVVVLRYYADLTEQQTALELGISVGTVKSTASRALQRVRTHLLTDAPAAGAVSTAVATAAAASSAAADAHPSRSLR